MNPEPERVPRFEPADRAKLLARARTTIERAAGRLPLGGNDISSSLPVIFREKTAVFVTLSKNKSLRGCIGTLKADKPLWTAVQDSAWSAACEDHRFKPVVTDELEEVSIEISVLSPLKEIPSCNDFSPGAVGIVIEKGGHRGVFLPKVALEMNWGREQTLSALCKKSGLPVNAWQLPGMRFWMFTVESFSEDSPES